MATEPGDDCVIPRLPGSRLDLFVTTAPVIRNHHFLDDTPLGWSVRKAVVRAISDIATMGGDAAWILTDIVAPDAFPPDAVRPLYRHLEAAVREFGLSIVVGDRSAGTDLEIPCHHPRHHPCGTAVLRTSARPGDALFFSGILSIYSSF